ncbi:MAG: LOG family protein [Bacteroidota bacterium]
MNDHPVVTLFGSSRPVEGSEEYSVAEELGRRLAAAGFSICNGGYGGTMEATARGAAREKEISGKSGIRIIGITCTVFGDRRPNPWVEETLTTGSLFDRLQKLLSLGDAYVVLQGGTGTLLELALAWEVVNKRMVDRKPILLLGSFWQGLLETMKDEMEREGRPDPMLSTSVATGPAECVQLLTSRIRGENS